MTQAYTLNDLVRYLYNEVSSEEKLALQQAMEYDFDLKERFNELKASKDALNRCESASPKASTIANILRYSSESALETSC